MWSATLFGIALATTRIESGALGPLQGWSAGGSLLTGALRDLSDGWMLPFVVAGIGTASGLVWLALATRPSLPRELSTGDQREPAMS